MSFHRIKPILFNTEMVRAILDGRKTVTRRVIKPRYRGNEIGFRIDRNMSTGQITGVEIIDDEECGTDRYVNPPYQIGDFLYVRETWARLVTAKDGEMQSERYVYKATDEYPFGESGYIVKFRWKPSIHMPKEAARIWLKVTDVRVERLQEITDEGCKAEGTNLDDWYDFDEWQHQAGDGCVADGIPVVFETLRGFFGSTIWNSTLKSEDEYDKYCWNANPWVWVIEFEKIDMTSIQMKK